MATRNAKLLAATGVALAALGVVLDLAVAEAVGVVVLVALAAEWAVFRWQVEVSARRKLRFAREVAPVAWLGDEVAVRLRLANESAWTFPHVEVREVLPPHLDMVEGPGSWTASLGPGGEVEWEYVALAERVGRAGFPGVAVTLASFGGLFLDTVFLESPAAVSIYPPVFRRRKTTGFVKPENRFRQLGQHLHPRPGLGLELLELRDYAPGDPPQLIAWRASARRENLVVREMESEVPMRITVFLDVSASMRLQCEGGTLLDRAIPFVAQFARSALDAGDRIGLATIGERSEQYLLPDRGRTHLLKLLEALVARANLSPGHDLGDPRGLLEAVERYAEVRFPHLLGAPWNPPYRRFLTVHPIEARAQSRRKRIATVLGAYFEDAPVRLAECIESAAAMARRLVEFAEAEGIRVEGVPLATALATAADGAPKLGMLERALRYAVRRAVDSELFLVHMNFAMLEDRLDGVVDTLRAALAHGHRALVLGPWMWMESAQDESPVGYLTRRYRDSLDRSRERFVRAGIPFAEASPDEPPGFLLAQVRQLRYGRRAV
jgi:uncharacterized protein (DUF58 family)